jgi:hypothetical protein
MHATEGTSGLNSIDLGYFVIGNLYIIFVIICFIVYLNRLKNVPKGKKTLWKGLIVFGHAFTIPFFWYFYIWRGKE